MTKGRTERLIESVLKLKSVWETKHTVDRSIHQTALISFSDLNYVPFFFLHSTRLEKKTCLNLDCVTVIRGQETGGT